MNPRDAVLGLLAAGWSESRIAREVGASQPTIHRVKHGAQRRGLSFDLGRRVLDLYAREFPADPLPADPAADEAA
jgi:hypothetical protein